jgi:hypothetical protein
MESSIPRVDLEHSSQLRNSVLQGVVLWELGERDGKWRCFFFIAATGSGKHSRRDLCHAARCQISSTVVDNASDSFGYL